MNHGIVNFLISLIGFALIWFGYKGITKGVIRVKGGFKISKEEKPTLYWINIIIYVVIGIAGLIFALTTY
ncbi:MAG: hypothetical protein J7M10_06700 [Candidatus Cloacimonetes bacterium]|nr:hypothetical protein [Candidatus Cloacimonadota bacterium]